MLFCGFPLERKSWQAHPMWHTSSVVPFPSAQMSGQELGNPGLTLSPLKTNSKNFMHFLLLKEGGYKEATHFSKAFQPMVFQLLSSASSCHESKEKKKTIEKEKNPLN